MTLDEAITLLASCTRNELRDHAFGDCEVYWRKNDVKTKSGTCDRWLCLRCAVSVGSDRDYCPAHHRLSQETKVTP